MSKRNSFQEIDYEEDSDFYRPRQEPRRQKRNLKKDWENHSEDWDEFDDDYRIQK